MRAVAKQPPDADAVGLVPTGPADMRSMFDAHAVVVARTVRALTCGQGPQEDLVQEVFAVAFARRDRFDGTRPLDAWLRGIAVNLVRSFRRREGRRKRLWRRSGPTRAPVTADNPESALEASELERALWTAVEALPDPLRETFALRVVEQRSLKDCADMLGVSVKSVSRRAIEAERRVRAALEAP